MTEKPPQSLERLWDELPTGRAPIDGILAAGLAAKRRKRRLAMAGVAAATVLVVGGGVVTAQTLTRPQTNDETPVADSPAAGIEVTVTIDSSGGLERGAAVWDPETKRLRYASRVDYSGSCPPRGTATGPHAGRIALELTRAEAEQGCTADAQAALATITGLATSPREVRVTENDETRTVTVTTAEALPQDADKPDSVEAPEPRLVEDTDAPVPPDLDRLVRAFVRYAVGGSDTFPHDDWVSMSIGGETVQSVDDVVAALPNREIWTICPAGWDAYGASSCPVNLLGPVIDAGANDAVLVYTAEPGDVTCAPTRRGPLPDGRLVVLTPEPEWRTCASDFALALAADEQGRLRSIDLTLAEP